VLRFAHPIVDNWLFTTRLGCEIRPPLYREHCRVHIIYLLPSLGYGLYLGSVTGNWTLLLLAGGSAVAMQLARAGASISATEPVQFLGNRVRIGKRLLPRFSWLWPSSVRTRVYLEMRQLEPIDRSEIFARELAAGGLVLGVDLDGSAVRLELAHESSHLLVIGPTGSGKTQLLRLIACGWQNPIWVLDFKGGMGFEGFAGLERLATNLDENLEDFWAAVTLELDRREAGGAWRPLLLVVDELGAVLATRSAPPVLERVVSKGRSLGVHLVAANQTLSAVGRTLVANCALRVVVGSVDPIDAAQLAITEKLPTWATAILKSSSGQLPFWFPKYRAAAPATTHSAAGEGGGVNPLLDLAGYPRQQSRDQRAATGKPLNLIG
jgi:hypothetical protein